MNVKHVTFNPVWGPVDTMFQHLEEDGWMLSHIVPVSNYSAVAVFVKPEPEEEEKKTKGYL